MARSQAAIPAAPTKTLLEWIDTDDGDTSTPNRPICAERTQALHARFVLGPGREAHVPREALVPPAGLRLPPLG